MPSIAQQDYLNISGKGINDAKAIGAINNAIKRGTVFDIVFRISCSGKEVATKIAAIGKNGDNWEAVFFDYATTTALRLSWVQFRDYSDSQFAGLYAIQEAEGNYADLPSLSKTENHLVDNNEGEPITVNGKYVIPTVENDTLVSVQMSDEEYDGIEVAWEDVQKLIGVFCGDND